MRIVTTAHQMPQKPVSPVAWLLTAGVFSVLIYAATTHYTATRNIPQDYQLNMAKSSGRNDPHANQKVREQAEKEFEKVREEYQKWNKKPNKTPGDKKIIENLRKQLERLRKKKDFGGETHSRKSKGN